MVKLALSGAAVRGPSAYTLATKTPKQFGSVRSMRVGNRLPGTYGWTPVVNRRIAASLPDVEAFCPCGVL
jgi:hypothetical protein